MEATTGRQIVQGIAANSPASCEPVEGVKLYIATHKLAAAVRKAEELGLVPPKTWREYDEESINKIKAVLQAARGA